MYLEILIMETNVCLQSGQTRSLQILYSSLDNHHSICHLCCCDITAVILAASLYTKSDSASKEMDKYLDDIDRVQQELGEDMRRGELGSVRGLGSG